MKLAILILALLLSCSLCSSRTFEYLQEGSSLNLEKTDVLVSPDGRYVAGFHSVGINAFSFAIWFNKSSTPTLVWMINRDQPVNGIGSKLSLLKHGNLILSDADSIILWESNTNSSSSVHPSLSNSGNLVLTTLDEVTLWESFDFPTDTLLPEQTFRKGMSLIASRSQTNYSAGYHKFYFDTENVIRLLFEGPDVASVYWPSTGSLLWDVGRRPYNNTRVASLDRLGYFSSSDNLTFRASDAGIASPRRLKLDSDGNLRIHSFNEEKKVWLVSWQAFSEPCLVHGTCGPNSLCNYEPYSRRRCSCMPGFKVIDPNDWIYGCKPEFEKPQISEVVDYLEVPKVDAYGYDIDHINNISFVDCQKMCTNLTDCKGFVIRYNGVNGVHQCWPKTQLLNAYHAPNFVGTMHIKIPRRGNVSDNYQRFDAVEMKCPAGVTVLLDRIYEKKGQNGSIKILLWVAVALGGIELLSICLVFGFLYLQKSKEPNEAMQGYFLAATGFRRFSYDELKKATRGFSEELGRGGGGTVYKGELQDGRIAAIKRLNQANQGEAEFLAEVSTLGKLNHMNLIDIWGYCAEGKHRLLVYEYMELGSLAQNLHCSQELDWDKRLQIALGTAKCLAYLHEECLEWVLHCDIKPQNILLDSNYRPKVADFGLSKFVNRDVINDPGFSKIRGTRGYMAPEWIFNQPISSKVDVYSYGIVVLEMITGKGPSEIQVMLECLKVKVGGGDDTESELEEILDPSLRNNSYDIKKMKTLIKAALECAEEEKDARPSMSQVVMMLHGLEDNVVINL